MGAPVLTPERTSPSWKELALLVGGLVLLFAAMVAGAGAAYLFARHFWIDEIFTATLVADPDPMHALDALAGGVDMNPPTFHLLLRGFTLGTGGPGEIALRAFAALSVLLALSGMYLLLRRVCTPFAAFAAVLVLGCHPLILTHAFEARFYGPWLAAIVWFAYALVLFRTSSRPILPGILLAVCAVVVCTIHYFGILTLGLVAGADLMAHRTMPPKRRRAILLVSLGPLALAACTPLYLRQRGSLTAPTWVGAANPQAVGEFLISIFRPSYLGLVLLAWLLSEFGQWARLTTPAQPARLQPWNTLAGLTSLLLLPLVLVAFSYAVLPVLVDRYALTTLAGVAPLLAFFLARTHRIWLTGLCAVLIVLGMQELHELAARARQADRRIDDLIVAIRRQPREAVVLFESSHELAVVCRYAPDLADRCYFLDFEPNQLRGINAMQIVVRDVARRYAAYYERPAILPWTEAEKLSRPLLVLGDPRFYRSRERYPGHGLCPLGNELYELRK